MTFCLSSCAALSAARALLGGGSSKSLSVKAQVGNNQTTAAGTATNVKTNHGNVAGRQIVNGNNTINGISYFGLLGICFMLLVFGMAIPSPIPWRAIKKKLRGRINDRKKDIS